MAIGKIKTLYTDTEKNEPLFPRTKTKAVTDSDGVGLDALLSNLAYAQEESDEIEISPIDSDTLGGLPADQYATKNFVKREVLFVQSGGEVDLDEYATKDEVANIDFPVDSINGKTGAVQLSASDIGARPNTWLPTLAEIGAQTALGFNPVQQGGGTDMTNNKIHIGWSNNGQLLAQVDTVPMGAIITTGDSSRAILPVSKGGTGATDAATARSNLGAFPITGGTLTGALNVGDNLRLWTDNEGGNIRVYPPSSNTYTDYWEMDSYNGSELRFYASRKSTNTNGSGLVFPLRMLTDGSISTGNNAKTRANLGITPANIGAAPSGYGLGESETISWSNVNNIISNGWYRMSGVTIGSFNLGYCFMFVASWDKNSVTQRIYDVQHLNCSLLRSRNTAGWGEWEWVNPPMDVGVEYRTTERYNGMPVYTRLVDFGTLPNKTTKGISVLNIGVKPTRIIGISGYIVHSAGHTHVDLSAHPNIRQSMELYDTGISANLITDIDMSAWSAVIQFKYV